MRVTILGSGTSSGVPLIGCRCATCTSDDPRDVRTRTSVWIEQGGASLIIDTSSDFRAQMLRHRVDRVDAVLYTHHHFDHISGFDDLRAYNYHTRAAMPIYATDVTLENITRIFAYAFGSGLMPGTAAPMVTAQTIVPAVPFTAAGVEILPIPLNHGMMDVMGFRIGNFAYCTDCNGIPDASVDLLKGLDMLIIDALRYTTHPTHFSLDESLEMISRIAPRRTLLTHIAHEMKHSVAGKLLPASVEIAVDGMSIDLSRG